MDSYIYEVIEHDAKFPAKIFITSIEKSSYHWHFDYELLLVLKGSVYLNIWPETCIVNEGNIILVNSKAVHGLRKTNQENICLFIQLKKDLFEYWQNKNQSFRFYLNSVTDDVKMKVPYSKFVRTAALIGLECSGKNIYDLYRMQALIYNLIADLFEYAQYDIRQYAENSIITEESDILLKIIEFIEENLYEENITEALCHNIGMSEKTLYRFLKMHTNMTVKVIAISIKLEKAQYLLTTTKKTIDVIAQESGFGSDSSFYRIFRKEIGVTPKEYRRYGIKVDNNKRVQGYLTYNKSEALKLLKSFTK